MNGQAALDRWVAPLDGRAEGSGEPAGREGWTARGSRTVLQRLSEAIAPSLEGMADAPRRVADALLRQAECMSPLMRLGFLMGLRLLDWSPVLLLEARHRLSRLPVARRRELLDRAHHSRSYLRRQLVLGYNGAIGVVFYDLPEARAALRYAIEPYAAECCRRREALLAADLAAGRSAPRSASMIRT